MIRHDRIVIDTNVYISHILNVRSIPSLAVLRAQRSSEILLSKAIATEIAEVVSRPKFEKYISIAVREAALSRILAVATLFEPSITIRACRHPKDNKFLELAVDGRADLILTGDLDLLALHPFRGIAIITPMQYLAED